jgi:hypothetical protein
MAAAIRFAAAFSCAHRATRRDEKAGCMPQLSTLKL